MTKQIVSSNTINALNKLPQDGTIITIKDPLVNSEEIYYYHHLKELGYVMTAYAETHGGVNVSITEKGKMVIQQSEHFNSYTGLVKRLYNRT